MVTEGIENNRPYPPPSNLISVLHRLQSRNLPDRIDVEYLRDASIPEGTLTRTLFALRFLGLLTEANEPSQALRSIHTSTDEEYRTILTGLIRQAYAEVFNVIDPSEDTQERILNVFRRYAPASQRSRMVIFFLGMCREAGIPTLDTPRQRSMTGGAAARPARGTPTRRTPDTAPREREQQRRRGQGDGGGPAPGQGGIAPALEGLIRSLPAPGSPLSEERRRQWLAMAKATLAFVYPPETGDEVGDGEEEA